jgi:hypothetical protein
MQLQRKEMEAHDLKQQLEMHSVGLEESTRQLTAEKERFKTVCSAIG